MRRNRGLQLNIALGACCIILVMVIVVMAVMMVGMKNKNGADSGQPDGGNGLTQGGGLPGEAILPVLTVDEIREQGDAVVVTTSYCTLKYPYAFSELIAVKAVTFEGENALEFAAVIGESEYKLYTIRFGANEGTVLGSLALGEEKVNVSVSVIFHELNPALEDDYHSTFYATQETFNDVVASLSENANYTSAN